MSNFSSFFDVDPRKIVEVFEGSPVVRLGGFAPEDAQADDWRTPALTYVNAHAPRPSVAAAIRRKALQLRFVWLLCLLAISAATGLIGFALGRHP